MSANLVVSNRGPLAFRAGPDGTLTPVRAAGGLASSLHRILAGTGTTELSAGAVLRGGSAALALVSAGSLSGALSTATYVPPVLRSSRVTT